MALTRISESRSENQLSQRRCEAPRSTISRSTWSDRPPLRTIVNNYVTPTPETPQNNGISNDTMSKTLIGTLLGAAIGAALVYVSSKPGTETASCGTGEPIRQRIYQETEPPSRRPRYTDDLDNYHTPRQSPHDVLLTSPSTHYFSPHVRAIEGPRSPGSRSITGVERPQIDLARYQYPEVSSPHTTVVHSSRTKRFSAHDSPSHPPTPRSTASSTDRTVTQANYYAASPSHGSSRLPTDARYDDDSRSRTGRSNHSSRRDVPVYAVGSVVEEVESSDAACSVTPNDSISQAGSRRSKRSHKSRQSSRYGDRHDRRGDERSAASLPGRDLGDERVMPGKRSVVSQFFGR